MDPIPNAAGGRSLDKACRYLKDRILNLELRPGDRLNTVEIAETLGLSRTPVREALVRLEQGGLVTRDSGWGYVVRGLGAKEISDIYKVREALEAEAAREAVAHVDERSLAELRDLLNSAEAHWEAGRVAEFRQCTRLFHLTIARIADNATLQALIAAIDDRVRLVGAILFDRHQARGGESLEQNRAVLNALAERDVAGVDRAVRAHVKDARERMVDALAFGDIREEVVAMNERGSRYA